MLHFRLICAPAKTTSVVDVLMDHVAVSNISLVRGASIQPTGDLVLADVAIEGANSVISHLRALGVHHDGTIAIERVETTISDAAMRADEAEAGVVGDAVVWEETEGRMRDEGELSVSFLVLMAMATMIAAIGIIVDSPVLIVGAMAIGPDYGPVASAAFFLQKQRLNRATTALITLALGLGIGVVAALALTLLARGLRVDAFAEFVDVRTLTRFTADPGLLSAVVALIAGVAGAISVTEARLGALTGVLVSVTTIPAAANMGVAAAYGDWSEAAWATGQLLLNVAALLVAGVATIAVQRRYGRRLVRMLH